MNLPQLNKEFEDINNLQSKLLEELHLVRLNIDLMLTNANIANNEIIHAKEDSSFLTKITYGITNEFNNIKLDKLNKEKAAIEEKINKVNKKTVNYDEVIELINATFLNDENNVSKYLFSITLINNNEDYLYEEISLKTVSTMLWEDELFLKNLQSNFKDVYYKIGSTSLSKSQKYTLGATLGLALATAVILTPLIIVSAPLVIPASISAFTAASITGVGLTVGTTYAAMKTANKQLIKNDFKTLNYEEITYILTMKSLLLDYSFNIMEKDQFKNYLNDVLLMTSDLKSDSLYYALVENSDLERNEKLTDAYYRFDKQMLKKYR